MAIFTREAHIRYRSGIIIGLDLSSSYFHSVSTFPHPRPTLLAFIHQNAA